MVSSYCCSSYRVTDRFSSLGIFSSSFTGVPVFHPIDDCEHSLLYLPGTDIASQETAISGSCQQNLAGICNSVRIWCLIMVWIPGWGSLCMVLPSVSAPNFVSVIPSMGILFPIRRRNKVSTLWSSFFLSFMCLANFFLGVLCKAIFNQLEYIRFGLFICRYSFPPKGLNLSSAEEIDH